ncbi:MAG: hypothetical protein RJB38_960 [Pseudomonadota bacterium]|jgi:lysophospholipase L1-like esterase
MVRSFRSTVVLAALAFVSLFAFSSAPDFEFHDGDVVAFIGDSNTEWGTYHQVIEAYTHLRFPERRVLFYNAGRAGDTLSQAASWRVEHDILQRTPKPTKIFLTFGINDLAWGDGTPEAMEKYRFYYYEGIRQVIEAAQNQNPPVDVYVLSYPTLEPPTQAELKKNPWMKGVARLSRPGSILHRTCEEGLALARSLGAKTLDIEKVMTQLVAEKAVGATPVFHDEDGVHLNGDGSQLVAFSILKLLNAPTIVSDVEFSWGASAGLRAGVLQGAWVDQIQGESSGRLQFVRHDSAWPLVQGFTYRNTPSPLKFQSPMDSLSQYRLRIRDLPEGRYKIEANGSRITAAEGVSAADLHQGINLASFGYDSSNPRSPWAVISREVWMEGSKKAYAENQRLQLLWSGVRVHDRDSRLKELDHEILQASRRAMRLSQPRPIEFVVEKVE